MISILIDYNFNKTNHTTCRWLLKKEVIIMKAMKNFLRMITTTTITATLMMSVLTGCGASSNTSTTSNNNSDNAEVTASDTNELTPTTLTNTKDTIRLPLGSEIDSLDPLNSAAGDTNAIMMNVFEGLLRFSESGEFLPALALSYDILDDGLTYKFYLNEDVKFHNGEEFSADDVIYTYNRLGGFDGYDALSTSVSSVVESIEALDDYTVVMNLLNHDSAFLTKCINPIVKVGYDNDAVIPNGTGPYKFVEYIHGEKVVFEIYDDYNTTDTIKPTVQNIEVNIMTDSNAILLALKTGGLDIATVLANDIPSLENEYTIYNFPQNMVQYLALNNTIPGLDNPDVRQAINLAVNKQEIIDLACFGAGTQVETFLSPVMAVYYDNTMANHQQDLDTARELLVNAGYDEFTFTTKVPSNYQTHVDTAQVIKDQLSKIGVTMEIELVEWATWLEDVYRNADYEGTICAQTGKLDPMDFLNRFTTSYSKNYFKYSSEEYDDIIARAYEEQDFDELVNLYKQAQNMLVDDAAAVFIQDPSLLYATTTDIEGVLNYPYRFIDFASFRFI